MMAYVKFLLPLIFIASLSVTDLKEPTAALVNLKYKSTPIIEKKLTSNSTCWNSYCKLTGRAEDVAPYCIVDLLARISLLFLKKLGLRSHWLLSNAWESGSTAWTASLPLPRLKNASVVWSACVVGLESISPLWPDCNVKWRSPPPNLDCLPVTHFLALQRSLALNAPK